MKSTVSTKPFARSYPCLMVGGTGVVVLFSREAHGTVVVASSPFSIGENRADWVMDTFRPFVGSVTLEND